MAERRRSIRVLIDNLGLQTIGFLLLGPGYLVYLLATPPRHALDPAIWLFLGIGLVVPRLAIDGLVNSWERIRRLLSFAQWGVFAAAMLIIFGVLPAIGLAVLGVVLFVSMMSGTFLWVCSDDRIMTGRRFAAIAARTPKDPMA